MMMLNSASASDCRSSPSQNCWTRYIMSANITKGVVRRLQSLWSREASLVTAVWTHRVVTSLRRCSIQVTPTANQNIRV